MIRILTAILAVLVLASGGAPSQVQAAESASLQPGSCPVRLPTSRRVDCSRFRVPEVRGAPDRGMVELQVAIIRAPDALPDPILFLMGGPGYAGVSAYSTNYTKSSGLSGRRDVILVDTRGTGSSKPRLGCRELDQVWIDAFPRDPTLDELLAAHRRCRTKLTNAGVEPRAYGSLDVALDLRDLRLALGVQRWNVLALSAGGEGAIELMRIDGSAIRSVILDTPVTRALQPSFDYWVHGNALAERSFEQCAAQSRCNTAYPNLRSRFYAEVARLDANPIRVDVAVAGGGHVTWTVDGEYLVKETARLAGDPAGARRVPYVADLFARGNLRGYLENFVLRPRVRMNGSYALGRNAAARCRDAVAFESASDESTARSRAPHAARLFEFDRNKKICAVWDVGQANAGHGYLHSSLPVLTLRAEWDTAPDDAGRILAQAGQFPNGFAYTFPNRGHVLLRSDTGSANCPRSIAAQFLAQPGSAPNAGCIANMSRTVFHVP